MVDLILLAWNRWMRQEMNIQLSTKGDVNPFWCVTSICAEGTPLSSVSLVLSLLVIVVNIVCGHYLENSLIYLINSNMTCGWNCLLTCSVF